MSQKSLVWTGMMVGSTIGGLVPLIWGGDAFSVTSVILTALGGILGIWAAIRISNS